jgi:glycogen synthase kinase 3 beta
LVSKILKYNPEKRPTPLDALAEPFFDELREEGKKLPNNHDLPDLFNFSDEERNSTSKENLDALIPEWYKNKN